MVKNPCTNADMRHVGSIPLWGRSAGEENGNPLQCSCLENPRDGGAWWAAVYGVAQSRTRLKCLSSSSSSILYNRNQHSVVLGQLYFQYRSTHRKRDWICGYQRWGWRERELDEGGQNAQTSSCKKTILET